jgi:hypothetical protein
MWRSPVARTLGVGEVQGSNPCIPTIAVKNVSAGIIRQRRFWFHEAFGLKRPYGLACTMSVIYHPVVPFADSRSTTNCSVAVG